MTTPGDDAGATLFMLDDLLSSISKTTLAPSSSRLRPRRLITGSAAEAPSAQVPGKPVPRQRTQPTVGFDDDGKNVDALRRANYWQGSAPLADRGSGKEACAADGVPEVRVPLHQRHALTSSEIMDHSTSSRDASACTLLFP